MLRPSYLWGIAFSLLDLGILAAFVSALGVYYSLGSKSTLRAMGAGMGTAVMVGGGYLMCCCPTAGIFVRGNVGDGGILLGALCMAPCMSLLLAWPTAVTLMSGNDMGREFGSFMLAYIIGTIGYSAAALMMTFSAIGRFDEKSGRIRGRSGHPPRPKTSA